MTPIPDKFDIAFYAEKHFNRNKVAAEVGVFKGEFAAHNLQYWKGSYYMVDTWAHRPEDAERGIVDKNDASQSHWDAVKAAAIRAVETHAHRTKIIQGYSVPTAGSFPNGLFDWVFLDAGHDFENFYNDLTAWWPKLRPGGLMSGDDYGLSVDHEALNPLTAERWAMTHGQVAKTYKWGTAPALLKFCTEYGVTLHVTWLNDVHNPAWYIIKPI